MTFVNRPVKNIGCNRREFLIELVANKRADTTTHQQGGPADMARSKRKHIRKQNIRAVKLKERKQRQKEAAKA